MSVGEEVQVEVGALAPGGDAAARQVGGEHAGRVVFVPLAAPGDRGRVRIDRERRQVAFGELLALDHPSAVRVPPPCPLFGRCGGCQWQHVTGEAQRAAKGAIVARALSKVAPGVSVKQPARAVGPEFGYRDRARFTVGERAREGGGGRVIGFRARRSHEVIDVPRCPLLSPEAAAALPALRERFKDAPPGTQIALQAGGDGRVAVGAGGRQFTLEGEGGAATLVERDPGDARWWPDVAEPGGRPLPIPAGAFAQVGRAANTALVAAVDGALGADPGRVLELHAGSGNFTRLLVKRARSVVASDGELQALARGQVNVPEASWRPWINLGQELGGLNLGQGAGQSAAGQEAAKINLGTAAGGQAAGLKINLGQAAGANLGQVAAASEINLGQAAGVEINLGQAAGGLGQAAGGLGEASKINLGQAFPADTVVVDPPREGLDAGSLALAGGAGRALVYVSCDPQTLGRDAGRLALRGLYLREAVVLDLMPQTHHVEVVAVFVRRG